MKIFIGTIAVLVALVAAFVIWWHEMNIVPTITLPNPPPAPSPNAYDFFVSAATLEKDKDTWTYALSDHPPGYKDPSDSDDRYYSLSEQEAFLNENLPMLAKVREGLPYDYYPTGIKPPYFNDRNFSHLREEARLFGLASKVHSEQGNWNEALRDELDCIEFGEKVEKNGAVIARLVGIACQAIGRKRAWTTIDHLDGDQARAGALRLESILNTQTPLSETLLAEKWQNEYETAKAFRARAGEGTVLGVYEGYDQRPAKNETMKLLTTSKQSVVDHYASYMDALANRSKLPLGAAVKQPVALPDDPLSALMVSFVDLLLFRDADNNAANDLLMTSLALKAYQVDHGGYPVSLPQLVPRYLHAVPTDPFAAGGPLRYRKTVAKYVLYSVGPDGVDDVGKPITYPDQTGQLRTMVESDSKGDMVAGVNLN